MGRCMKSSERIVSSNGIIFCSIDKNIIAFNHNLRELWRTADSVEVNKERYEIRAYQAEQCIHSYDKDREYNLYNLSLNGDYLMYYDQDTIQVYNIDDKKLIKIILLDDVHIINFVFLKNKIIELSIGIHKTTFITYCPFSFANNKINITNSSYDVIKVYPNKKFFKEYDEVIVLKKVFNTIVYMDASNYEILCEKKFMSFQEFCYNFDGEYMLMWSKYDTELKIICLDNHHETYHKQKYEKGIVDIKCHPSKNIAIIHCIGIYYIVSIPKCEILCEKFLGINNKQIFFSNDYLFETDDQTVEVYKDTTASAEDDEIEELFGNIKNAANTS